MARLRLSLRQQIAALATLAALFATSTVAVLVLLNQNTASRAVSDEVNSFTEDRVVRCAQKAANVCDTVDGFVQGAVDTDLNAAVAALKRIGGVHVGSQTISWNAINQFSQDRTLITAPVWSVGGTELRDDRSSDHHQRFIDEITQESGYTVTLFQRVNAAGDMLRIATSVVAPDGQRAINTYIPATQPDGTPNAVIKTVLMGQTYRGRAYVVNGWYIAAYKPLLDAQGKNIGMLSSR